MYERYKVRQGLSSFFLDGILTEIHLIPFHMMFCFSIFAGTGKCVAQCWKNNALAETVKIPFFVKYQLFGLPILLRIVLEVKKLIPYL